MNEPMAARWIVVAFAAVAACAQPASDACNDGTFCPEHTSCGVNDLCFAHVGECGRFDDRMPCLVDEVTSGFCVEGACAPGLEVIGYAVSIPSALPLPGVEVVVRDHPEILGQITNVNGYFGIRAPHDVVAVIELSYPDTIVSVSRPILVGSSDVQADLIYGGIPMIPVALATLLAEQAGRELLPGRGMVTGQTVGSNGSFDPIGGVAVTLASGSCEGPWYFERDGTPAIGAQTTIANNGTFAFVNCELSAAEIVGTLAGAPCRVLDAPAPGPIAVTPESDRVTAIGRISCP